MRVQFLSVPSSSGWCVKLYVYQINSPYRDLPFSSLFIGMVCEASSSTRYHASDITFQFPLHRDGV